MTRRRLLLIAFHYPPIQGSSGVHRALAFSKFLHEFGWDVTVLTVTPGAHERIHADNSRLIPEHVEVIRARAWDAARHFAIRGRYPSALARPDRWASWIPFATWTGGRLLQARRFDAIFSTFPIASAHVVGRKLHERSGLPWAADFRDPMATLTFPHDESLRRLWMEIQSAAVRHASRITTTTPGAAEFYRRLYSEAPADRFVAIENGFDPDAFAKAGPSRTPATNTMTLLHSGVIYPRERDPRPFFRALRRLIDRGDVAQGSFRVCLRASGFEEHLLLRLWAAGGRFRNVDELVLRWRDHPARLTRTDERFSLDAFVRCKVHHLRATLLQGRRVVVWGAGPVGKSFGRALGPELAAFVEVDPRKIGREIYGVPVLSVDEAPRFADAFALGAVAGEEARRRIRREVAAQGRVDGVDFVAVA